ncbi:hypothetical protein GCM10027051_29540 [Niabella terrae]
MIIKSISSEELAEINALYKSFLKDSRLSDDDQALLFVHRKVELLRSARLEVEEISGHCFELGSAYGTLIQKSYGWGWFRIVNSDEFAYAICTPKHSYGIQVFHYFNLLLTTNKENNTILLFNMIRELNDNKTDQKIKFLL